MHRATRRVTQAILMGVMGGALLLGPLGGRALQAAPYLPQVGDELRYRVSNGDVAIARVIRTRGQGDRTYAQVVQTLLRQGSEPQTARFTLIRTSDGMAIQMPSGTEGLQLSPLVYYLGVVDQKDSWIAQRGTFRDSDGQEVGYELTAELQATETVTVKAGTFEGCSRISYRTNLPTTSSGPPELTFWVKPEIGIVKTRSVQNGQVTETELLSFERAAYARP